MSSSRPPIPTLTRPKQQRPPTPLHLTTPRPPLARSHSQRPLGRKLLTKAEFVFASPDSANSVQIAGDWNEYSPTPLIEEQPGLWSTVILLTTGYHEFRFIVDGVPTQSERHPTTDAGMHWRNVHGPPGGVVNRSAFAEWANDKLRSVGLVTGFEDVDGLPAVDRFGGIGEARREGWLCWVVEIGWPSLVAGSVVLYLIGTAIRKIAFG